MKKWKVALAAVCITVTMFGGTAYATRLHKTIGGTKTVTAVRAETPSLQKHVVTVNKEQSQINALRVKLRYHVARVKLQIKVIKAQNKPLTTAQMDEIQNILAAVKSTSQQLKTSQQALHEQVLALRAARKNKDATAFADALSQIAAIQQQEVQLLNDNLTQLKTLDATLGEVTGDPSGNTGTL